MSAQMSKPSLSDSTMETDFVKAARPSPWPTQRELNKEAFMECHTPCAVDLNELL